MRRTTILAAGLALAAAPAACNLVTGADDLVVFGGTTGSGGAGGDGGSSQTGSPASSGPGGGGATGGGGGSAPMCTPPCGQHAHCEDATLTCVCDPGYVQTNGVCAEAQPGDPVTHTQAEVCNHWKQGHVVTEPSPLVASGAMCDAGSLKTAAITDTLVRINMFRWMVGLGPTTNDPALDANAQKCANLEAFWDFNMGGSPHSPPPSVPCYTPEGGATAGQSNIAWGSGHPAQAIDQFMEDWGNETTMGHRRWILNPPLNPVGIGYWQTGGQYGNAECLQVFGSSGNGPNPAWVSMPPAGFAPMTTAQWTWTFHGSIGGIPDAGIAMLRVDDNMPLAVTIMKLNQGYAQDTISWLPNGWQPQAGKTYRVTVSGLAGGDVVYDVKPVDCN